MAYFNLIKNFIIDLKNHFFKNPPVNNGFPFLTSSMFPEVNSKIDNNECRLFYIKFMSKIHFYSNDDIVKHADILIDKLKFEEEFLSEAINEYDRYIKEHNKNKDKIEKKLDKYKTTIGNKYANDEEEFFNLKNFISHCLEMKNNTITEITNLNNNKKDFVINYINTEIHGNDWEKKTNFKEKYHLKNLLDAIILIIMLSLLSYFVL